jgi:hypothetical protein
MQYSWCTIVIFHCRQSRYNRHPTFCAQIMSTPKLFDDDLNDAIQQLCDETIEAMQLAKVSPDLDDLSATFAVALLKIGLAAGLIEQRQPGFANDMEEKRQRVIATLTPKH